MSVDITKHKRFKKIMDFYNGDEFVSKTWSTKYGLIDEDTLLSPPEAWDILSGELETKYVSKAELYNSMKGFKFILGGRILHGILRLHFARKRGESVNLTLSNCLYTGGPDDSMESIMKFASLHAHVLKYGYGNGLHLNNLRPDGCKVNNAAKSTAGVVPFANLYSEITNTIGHAGRRGASIIFLDCTHPDVVEFIKSKTQDENYIKGANISIMISDDFMKAVENDSDWELKFENDKASIKRMIKAKEIFDLICTNAWDWAEPGIIFKDRMVNYNPGCFHPESTPEGVNPCLTGDMLISVADGRGMVPIKQLVDEEKDVPVYSLNKETGFVEIKTGRNPRLTGRNKKILKVTLDDGSVVRCTENHKFILRNLSECEAKDLTAGDSLFVSTKSFNKKTSYWNISKIDNVKFSKIEHRYVYQFYNDLDNKIFNTENKMVVHHIDGNPRNNLIENLRLMKHSEHNRLHMNKNNPMQNWWNETTEENRQKYRKKMSESTSGFKNGKAIDVSKDEHLDQIKECLNGYNGPITKSEWRKHAGEKGYCRNSKLYKTYDLIDQLNFEIFGYKKEWSIQRYHSIIAYRWYIQNKDNSDLVIKFDVADGKCYCLRVCEKCNSNFWVEYSKRERAFCSSTCAALYQSEKYLLKANKVSTDKFHKIYNEFIDYSIRLDRFPSLEEWKIYFEDAFKIPYNEKYSKYDGLINRIKREYRPSGMYRWSEGSFSWNAIKEDVVENVNHKVVSVEFDGYEDVYNITVDDNHIVGTVLGKIKESKSAVTHYNIYQRQCGEISMAKYEQCVLGAVMLDKFYVDNTFNFEGFRNTIRVGILALNAVLDYELKYDMFALPEIREKAEKYRRIGLGISALGDVLGLMRFGYNMGADTTKFLKELLEEFRTTSYITSQNLATEHGIIVNDFDTEKYYSTPFFEKFNIPKDKPIANVTVNTIAPTGSLSIIGGGIYDIKNNKMIYSNCSSGIEPVFMRTYTRKTNISGKQETFEIWHNAIKYAKEMRIVESDEEIKNFFPQAYEVNWKERVKLQGLIQKYIDNSISSTVNLGNHTTVENVKELYMLAWKSGCKGITVYRSGCKREGILCGVSKEKPKIELKDVSRPEKLFGFTEKFKFPEYDAFITVNSKEGIPLEIFLNVGKSGSELGCYTEAIGRLISLCLSYHIPLGKIINQLENIASNDVMWHKFTKKPIPVTSVVDAIAKMLKYSFTDTDDVTTEGMQICPKCKEKSLSIQEGCMECLSCGYSKCS